MKAAEMGTSASYHFSYYNTPAASLPAGFSSLLVCLVLKLEFTAFPVDVSVI